MAKQFNQFYNKHINLWADYSHGVRLVQNNIIVDRKKTTIKNILKNAMYFVVLSDEGIIEKPNYPITGY